MGADIPVANRAEHGIGNCMERDVGIRVPRKPLVMRDLHPAQPQLRARFEPVHVEALADAEGGAVAGFHKILRKGDLLQTLVAIDEGD